MKKTVFVLSVVMLAGLFVACNKENPVAEKTPITIGASILDAEEDVTKVNFDKSTYKLTWENGDVIRLYAPKKAELRTEYLNTFNINTIGPDGKTANFKEAVPHDWSDAGEVLAFYGKSSQIYARYGGANYYFPRIIYPREQVYNPSNNPEKELLFMCSQKVTITGNDYTPLKNLHFAPVASLVKISVKDSGNSGNVLYSITLTCWGTSQPLAGMIDGYFVNWDTYAPMEYLYWSPSYGEGTNPDNKVVSLTDINTAMTTTVKDYYIVVYPAGGTTGHGNLKVTLTSTTGVAKEYKYSEFFINTPGSISNFPVIDWSN